MNHSSSRNSRSNVNLLTTYARATTEAMLETLWPTHCISCNQPGYLLCKSCQSTLPYIDYWNACSKCGAPSGRVQCCECNPVILDSIGLEELPFTTNVSATLFEQVTSRIVITFKDRGERRFAAIMASILKDYLNPDCIAKKPTITFIPATAQAIRNRGFDHAQLLATNLAEMLDLICIETLERPQNKDQRALSRNSRFRNMEGRFALKAHTDLSSDFLLIDDVYTTGATLAAASATLHASGVQTIHCATFARVI